MQIQEVQMKPQVWKISRKTVPETDGQRRWDLAYQCLLKWGKVTEQIPDCQEASHESSHVCPGFDPTTSTDADHRTTD